MSSSAPTIRESHGCVVGFCFFWATLEAARDCQHRNGKRTSAFMSDGDKAGEITPLTY